MAGVLLKDFIKEDALKNIVKDLEPFDVRLAMVCYGGSIAYGTSIDTSDVDLRGVAVESKEQILGIQKPFEAFRHPSDDIVIYGLQKLVYLLSNCNPSIIEMLGCREEHYLYKTRVGTKLINNKHAFLSKRAVNSFMGYATEQLRKLQNELTPGYYDDKEKLLHTLKSIESVIRSFNTRYKQFEEGSVQIKIGDSLEFDQELQLDVNLTHYPLRDYKNMISEMRNIEKQYAKLNHRNRKKDDSHLNKHAAHLLRLYMMCYDILVQEDIKTYRSLEERDLLLEVRNGKYQLPDGKYNPEFFDIVTDYEQQLEHWVERTDLPEDPDYKNINRLLTEIYEMSW